MSNKRQIVIHNHVQSKIIEQFAKVTNYKTKQNKNPPNLTHAGNVFNSFLVLLSVWRHLEVLSHTARINYQICETHPWAKRWLKISIIYIPFKQYHEKLVFKPFGSLQSLQSWTPVMNYNYGHLNAIYILFYFPCIQRNKITSLYCDKIQYQKDIMPPGILLLA